MVLTLSFVLMCWPPVRVGVRRDSPSDAWWITASFRPVPGVDTLDLSRTSVFLDFDGTITTADVGVHVLERTAPDGWRAIDEQFRHGVIDSRECILDEWELVAGDEATLRAIAAEVTLDPGVGPLV